MTKAEAEPNNTSATATPLPIGTVGLGDVTTAGDIDYWSFTAAANAIVKIELFGTRRDHNTWDVNANVPNIIVYDTDGTTMRVEHDWSGNLPGGAWGWKEHDLDLPLVSLGAAGTYFIAISQDDPVLPGGTYAIKVTTVSEPNIQLETEPEGTTGGNDTPGNAQTLTVGTLVGFDVDGENDYYKFHVTAPATVRFELTAYRNGAWNGDTDDLDTELLLYDVDGTTQLFDDDDAFFFDSAIQYQINTTGDYYVNVTQCCGTGDSRYIMNYTSTPVSATAESEPNDTTATADAISYGGSIKGTIGPAEDDYFRFTGTKGDMVRLHVFDSDSSQGNADFVNIAMLGTDGVTALTTGGNGDFRVYTTILQETGPCYIHVTPGGALTDYRLELSRFKAATYETEANDTIATANTLTTSAAGVIATAGDVDVFRFTAVQNRFTTISVYATDTDPNSLLSNGFFEYSGHGSNLDPLLTIKDAAGTTLASSTFAALDVSTECITDGLPTAAVSFVAPTTGSFYVQVESAGGTGDATHYYVITKH